MRCLFMYGSVYAVVCVLCWYGLVCVVVVFSFLLGGGWGGGAGGYGLVCVVAFALLVWFSMRRCICQLWAWSSIRR